MVAIMSKKKDYKENKIIAKFLTKMNITFFLLYLLDIVLVIFCARQNKVHYVEILDQSIFVGDTKNMLWGRNYINVLITLFFYLYTVLMNRYFLHRKNTKKFMITCLFSYLIINLLLFYVFTVRVH